MFTPIAIILTIGFGIIAIVSTSFIFASLFSIEEPMATDDKYKLKQIEINNLGRRRYLKRCLPISLISVPIFIIFTIFTSYLINCGCTIDPCNKCTDSKLSSD